MTVMIQCDILSSITLTIIATPIGNLKDITLRALETLQSVEGIICEDTRVTAKLLSHFQLKKPLIVLNDFNEARVFPQILERLKNRENLALVSDAGTPLISDPGYKLVRACLKEGLKVDSLPGPSAAITALTLSGLPPDKFLFLGYLPEKESHRQKVYEGIKNITFIMVITVIIFISPHKLLKTLEEILEAWGDVELSLANELTKMFQKVEIKKISDWLEQFKTRRPKGEYVMLIRI